MILWDALHAYTPEDIGYHLIELDRALRAAHCTDAADRLRVLIERDIDNLTDLKEVRWDHTGVWYGDELLEDP